MDTLYPLIKSLTPSEVKGIRAELKLHRAESKAFKLFDLLLKEKEFPNEKAISMKILGIERRRNLKLLVNRLEDKILDFLISERNLTYKSEIDDCGRAILNINKKITQMYYLNSTQRKQGILNKLNEEVISLSGLYEYYPGLMNGLAFQKMYRGIRLGEQEYRLIHEKWIHAKKCFEATERSIDLYYQLIIKKKFSGHLNVEDIHLFLKNGIIELTELSVNLNSATVEYYLKYLQIDYEDYCENYKKAIELGLEKIELIRTNTAIFRESRLGIAYDDIAFSCIMLGNFEDALNYTHMAQSYLSKKSYNYKIAKELEFLSLYYAGKYAEAIDILGYLFTELSEIDGFEAGKLYIYNSFLAFKRGDYIKAFAELNTYLEPTQDKSGWDIAMRVLMIMSLVELRRFEEASLHVDRLRKHVARYSKTEYITPRNITIFKLLQVLDSNGFVFELNQPRISALLSELKSPAQAWKPLTPELIPFHEWVEGSSF